MSEQLAFIEVSAMTGQDIEAVYDGAIFFKHDLDAFKFLYMDELEPSNWYEVVESFAIMSVKEIEKYGTIMGKGLAEHEAIFTTHYGYVYYPY